MVISKINIPLKYRPFLRRLLIGVVLFSPMIGFSNREQSVEAQAAVRRSSDQVASKKTDVDVKKVTTKGERNLSVDKF